jgi:hypothetical protein
VVHLTDTQLSRFQPEGSVSSVLIRFRRRR